MDVFRVEYQEVDAIVQQFRIQMEGIETIESMLQQAYAPLEASDWRGEGASAFFHAMNAVIIPAIRRLGGALAAGDTTLTQCARIVGAAEAEAAALFHGAAVSSPPAPNEEEDHSGGGSGFGKLIKDVIAFIQRVQTEHRQHLYDLLDGLPDSYDRDQLLDAIGGVDVATRQAILNDPTRMAQIHQLPAGDGNAITAALFEGALFWPGPSGPDGTQGFMIRDTSDFASWMRGSLPPSTGTGTMNCWEFLMYSAYANGTMTEAELRELHASAALNARQAALNGESSTNAYYAVIESRLGATDATAWTPGTPPPAGSPVFFDSGGGPLSHVAIATGRLVPVTSGSQTVMETEIISLWVLPGDTKHKYTPQVQVTTIEQMNAAMGIEFQTPDPVVSYGAESL